MSRLWWEARTSGVYELPCPECSDMVPEVLLCIHDDPLCPACCEAVHFAYCPECRHLGERAVWGTSRTVTCPTCGGAARRSQERSA